MPRSDRAAAPPAAAEPTAAAAEPPAEPTTPQAEPTTPAGITPTGAEAAKDRPAKVEAQPPGDPKTTPAKAEPVGAAKGKPAGAAPAKPVGAAKGEPAGAAPAKPVGAAKGEPAGDAPAKPDRTQAARADLVGAAKGQPAGDAAAKPQSAGDAAAKPDKGQSAGVAPAKRAKDEPAESEPPKVEARPVGEPRIRSAKDLPGVGPKAEPVAGAKATSAAADTPKAEPAGDVKARPATAKRAKGEPAGEPAKAKPANKDEPAKSESKDESTKDEPDGAEVSGPTPPADPIPKWAVDPPAPPGPLPPLAAAVLAAVSGTVMVTAFPPYGLWWLAPIAVALLALATRGQRIRRGAWLGALHGAAFFAPLLHWTGIYVGPMPWLLLAGLQTAFLAILGASAAGSSRFVLRVPWLAPLVTASLWVGQEALRSRLPWGGFPWGRVAFSQDESPFLRLASLGGAPLVTFAVALAGGLIAVALIQPWRTLQAGPWLRRVALIGGAAVLAAVGLAVPLAEPDGRKVTVAVVQGNVPRLGLDFNAQRRAVLEYHVEATRRLARRVEAGEQPQPDLVVWPENSSDIDPLIDQVANAEISSVAAQIGAPILVGAVLEGPGRFVSNAGIVWDPATGPGAQYVKRHPVPFAEYVPLRGLARSITDKVDLVRRDFKGGDKVGTLKLGPATIGDVICFEVAYDDLVRDTVDGGAQLLVVQTNNATFGMSAESVQQLAMVRLRAVEHGRPSIMASTSGVSATVDANGKVLDQSELFTVATFVRAFELGEHRTLATRLGGWPELVLALVGLAALLGACWLRFRRRGHSGAAPSVESTSERPETTDTDKPGEAPSSTEKASTDKPSEEPSSAKKTSTEKSSTERVSDVLTSTKKSDSKSSTEPKDAGVERRNAAHNKEDA